MSRPEKIAWGTIIAALGLAGTIAVFISEARAEAKVGPVREDVARMKGSEEQREKRFETMEKNVREIHNCLINGKCKGAVDP